MDRTGTLLQSGANPFKVVKGQIGEAILWLGLKRLSNMRQVTGEPCRLEGRCPSLETVETLYNVGDECTLKNVGLQQTAVPFWGKGMQILLCISIFHLGGEGGVANGHYRKVLRKHTLVGKYVGFVI